MLNCATYSLEINFTNYGTCLENQTHRNILWKNNINSLEEVLNEIM